MLDDIKRASYQEREKILIVESKVIQYSLAIQEKIQHIVKKQALLLQSYLEHTNKWGEMGCAWYLEHE